MSPREAALRILVDKSGASRELYLSAVKSASDRALADRLATGTLKWQGLLDHCLAPFSRRPLKSLKKRVLWALRLGAYQMLLMGVPPYAAVSTILDSLRDRGERSFVNGVLGALSRHAGHLEMPSLDEHPVFYASLRYSYPEWIARLFISRFGLPGGLTICALGNEPPPLILRVNSTVTSPERFISVLKSHGIEAYPGRVPGSVRLAQGALVTGLPGFKEGHFVVQDEAAMVVSLVVGARPGERVWDACAAPGGKTEHLAEMMKGEGTLLATDIDGARVEMARGTMARMGFGFVRAHRLDVLDGPESLGLGEPGAPFDRILLDAPCSGLGVIRRNADLRWNRKENDIRDMAKRQKALLEAVYRHLRPGGVLVYSTCTLTPQENEDNWMEFLRRADVEPEDPAAVVPPEVRGLFSGEPFAGPGYRYLLPHEAGTDGFFIARARRLTKGI